MVVAIKGTVGRGVLNYGPGHGEVAAAVPR